ncbi:MAG: hypothetical protein ACE5JZ_00260 [Kiloniellales bacterium]
MNTPTDGDQRPAPWLIGGPGRSGKTTLALALNKGEGPVAGFPVEGLFTYYLKRRFLNFPVHRRQLLAEYLTRPRYMDSDRDVVRRPIEFFHRPLTDILARIPATVRHRIDLIDWALQRFAEDNGRRTWAAFDLHPEFRYPSFRRRIPGLKLAVMVRDPRRSLHDMMHWRRTPIGTPRFERRFRHSLVMWCLGLQAARRRARRYPGDVVLFCFDALIRGEAQECARLADAFGMQAEALRAAFAFEPALRPEEGNQADHPGPDFSAPYLAEIDLLCRPLAGEFVRQFAAPAAATRAARRGFLRVARLLLALGRVSPRLARLAADFVYFPANSARRMGNSLLRVARDNLHAIGGRAPGDAPMGRRPGRPLFFVVAGAHGVGKSTTVAQCLRILERRSIHAEAFHHVVDTRGAGTGSRHAAGRAAPLGWRRLVPAMVKLVLVSLIDEVRYASRVHGLLRRALKSGKLSVADRYVYDRWVDLRIRGRPWTQIASVRLACMLMRKPRLVVVLEDDPAQIARRKSELTVEEIRRYQDDLPRFLERLGVPRAVVRIGGRDPAAVAEEAVRRMLAAAGDAVTPFLVPVRKAAE